MIPFIANPTNFVEKVQNGEDLFPMKIFAAPQHTRREMTKGQLAEALHVTRPTLERMIREHLETTARI